MKKELKKIFSCLLVVTLLFTAIPTRAVVVKAGEEQVITFSEVGNKSAENGNTNENHEASVQEATTQEATTQEATTEEGTTEEATTEEATTQTAFLDESKMQVSAKSLFGNNCPLEPYPHFYVEFDDEEEEWFYYDDETDARADVDEDGIPQRTPAIEKTEIVNVVKDEPEYTDTVKYGRIYADHNVITYEFDVKHDYKVSIDTLNIIPNSDEDNVCIISPENPATPEDVKESRLVIDHYKVSYTFDYSPEQKPTEKKYTNISFQVEGEEYDGSAIEPKVYEVIPDKVEASFVQRKNSIKYSVVEPERNMNIFEYLNIALIHSYKDNVYTCTIDDIYDFDKLEIVSNNGEIQYTKESGNKIKFTVETPIKLNHFRVAIKNEIGSATNVVFGDYGLNFYDNQEPDLVVDSDNPKGLENPNVENVRFYNDDQVIFRYHVEDNFAIDKNLIYVERDGEKCNDFNIRFIPKGSFIEKIFDQYRYAGYTSYDVEITIPEGEYENVADHPYSIVVKDIGEHRVSANIFDVSEDKIVVDSKAPTLNVSATKESGAYKSGDQTNEQITIDVEVGKTISGLENFSVQFVPAGKQLNEENWKDIVTYNYGTDLEKAKLGYQYVETTGIKIKDFVEKNENYTTTIVFDTEDANIVFVGQKPTEQVPVIKNSSKRGTYYFKASSFAKKESNADITVNQVQRNIPVGKVYSNKAFTKETGWFNEDNGKPDIMSSFTVDKSLNKTFMKELMCGEDELHNPNIVKMYVDVAFSNEKIFGNDQKINQPVCYTYTIDAEKVYKDVNTDIIGNTFGNGYYTITTWAEDVYGNRSVNTSYQLKMDLTAPDHLEITVAGDNFNLEEGKSTLVYDKFFSSAVNVSKSANDDLEKIHKPTLVLEATHGTLTGGNTVEPTTRCQLKLTATDVAGNESKIYSKGFVVDNESPVGANGQELTIIPKGANKYGFYNKDVEVELVVNDSPLNEMAASLKSVAYTLSHGGVSKENPLLTFDGTGKSDEELNKNLNFDEKITVIAKENEDNETKLTLKAIDNSEQDNSAEVVLPIDITAPVIRISFDNDSALNERYYKNYRTAKIEIVEKNFEPSFVEFDIEKNGYSASNFAPATTGWETKGDVHTAYIYFNQDGDYTLKVDCIDLADNKANTANVELFTIDATPAEIIVDYTEPVQKNGFINKNVTANITINEHSFDPSLVKLETNNKITLSGWSNNGDTHKATITFAEDGEYTYRITCGDLAGNMMDKMENEHFTIDTVLPEVKITGVEDESANAGEIAPVVTITDVNLDLNEIQIRLTDGKGQEINLQRDAVLLGNTYTSNLFNASSQADSVYHLKVVGTDKAGNETELEYRYSLNRHGSTYDLSGAKEMIDRVYNKFDDVSDIKIYEMNVDEIKQFNIYVTRNGETIQGKVVNARPDKVDKDAVVYSVQKSGNEAIGYTYTYTIYRENFKTEGLYNLTFTSEDKAGNHVNNTLAEKSADMSFIVDDTAPVVFIDGVKSGQIYDKNELQANVYVTDNFNLSQAVFTLVDHQGKETQKWDYKELVKEDGDILTIVIPESDEKQSLLYYVEDAAGNVVSTKVGDKGTPSEFLVSMNKMAQLNAIDENQVAMAEKVAAAAVKQQNPIPLIVEGSIAAVIVVAGGCATILLRKKKAGKENEK